MSPSFHTPIQFSAPFLSFFLLGVWGGGCDLGGKSGSDAYNEGCRDGYDFGYTNGQLHGEGCVVYDDDPGQRYADTGDIETIEYNQGYEDCYPDGYSDGFALGSEGVTCRRRRPAAGR